MTACEMLRLRDVLINDTMARLAVMGRQKQYLLRVMALLHRDTPTWRDALAPPRVWTALVSCGPWRSSERTIAAA